MAATGIFEGQYRRIVTAESLSSETSEATHSTSVKKGKTAMDKIDVAQISAIRNIITNFAQLERRHITIRSLQNKVYASYLGLQLSYRAMRDVLLNLGYK